jgi:voltage-gated potassium channel
MMTPERKLRLALLFFASVIALGTIGYSVIEGWRFLDALYMTITTLATVGFQEITPLSDAGRVFTIFLIVIGAFSAAYVIAAIARLILEGELEVFMGKRKMEKKVQSLTNHIIVCGYGRVGRQVVDQFLRHQVPFVVVESDNAIGTELRNGNVPYLEGSAVDDDILEKAGIGRARALVSTLPNDADNVYLTLTARQLNQAIYIIARAESALAKKKLQRAGANKVICPHELGGTQMAMATLRPNVVDFMELASVVPGGEKLVIEEIPIGDKGRLAGRSIVEAAVKTDYDVIVVGMRKKSGGVVFNPPGETVMNGGDILVALGEHEKLTRLATDLG